MVAREHSINADWNPKLSVPSNSVFVCSLHLSARYISLPSPLVIVDDTRWAAQGSSVLPFVTTVIGCTLLHPVFFMLGRSILYEPAPLFDLCSAGLLKG